MESASQTPLPSIYVDEMFSPSELQTINIVYSLSPHLQVHAFPRERKQE